MKTRSRILIYCGVIVFVVISSYFWGGPGQQLNMRQAQKEMQMVRSLLQEDDRYSDIRLTNSTAGLGKVILVKGSVPDEQSHEYLIKVVEKNISPKFKVIYAVEVVKPVVDTN